MILPMILFFVASGLMMARVRSMGRSFGADSPQILRVFRRAVNQRGHVNGQSPPPERRSRSRAPRAEEIPMTELT